jgi:hypothetical protein
MKIKLKVLQVIILIILFSTSLYCQEFETRNTAGMKWYKGNTHTHAREGESDSSIEYIVNWYQDNGYQFLVLTDHSTITLPAGFSAPTDSSFLLIPGEEITGYGNEDDLEINGLNIQMAIPPLRDGTVPGALQKCIDAVRRQNGIPVINHPNYKWRLDQNTLLGAGDCTLFELYNGFPGTNCQGDESHPGLEQVWDFLLTSGKRIYGIAADDAHTYQQFSAEVSNPGRGWIMVQSRRPDAKEIMQNLDSGLFYSSTGVEIENIIVKPSRLEIVIKDRDHTEYKTDFIGSAGKVLLSTKNNPAIYDLSTEKVYVRAKITDTSGQCAWIQPVFVEK